MYMWPKFKKIMFYGSLDTWHDQKLTGSNVNEHILSTKSLYDHLFEVADENVMGSISVLILFARPHGRSLEEVAPTRRFSMGRALVRGARTLRGSPSDLDATFRAFLHEQHIVIDWIKKINCSAWKIHGYWRSNVYLNIITHRRQNVCFYMLFYC